MSGEGIKKMLRVTGEGTITALFRLESDAKRTRIDLWNWVQHTICIITTDSVYGPQNPYRDPQVENAFCRLNEVPLISSRVQESLRYRSSGTGPLFVMEDTMLDDRFLLKRDSYVMILNHEMHFDTGTWGLTVQDFEAHRFVKEPDQKIHSGAFRGFGGGVNLCPGKAFAATEIVALVAMLALRFDIDSSSGHWNDPEQDLSNMALAIAPPKHKVLVDVTPRIVLKDAAWTFKV
ncbi:MAG: hypothetical protein Q9190_001461 [Brigantiaea leucoxantha]